MTVYNEEPTRATQPGAVVFLVVLALLALGVLGVLWFWLGASPAGGSGLLHQATQ